MRPKSAPLADGGVTNDGKLELSLMHFHHTNPKWQMPKQCEVYLEKIQERGEIGFSSRVESLFPFVSLGKYAQLISSTAIIE
jgi:hypothetical protein